MSSSVKLGFGLQLKRGDGASPEVFTAIAEVFAANLPSLSRAALDATSHDSADAFREFVGGLAEGGEISVEAHYLPANATHGFSTGLGSDFNDKTVRNFKMVLPNSLGTWAFSALVTKYNPTSPVDGKMTLSVTLKISGKPTFTA